MSFKDSYKKDNEGIKPREEVLASLSEKIKDKSRVKIIGHRKFNYKIVATIAAASVAFSIFVFAKDKLPTDNLVVNNNSNNTVEVSKDIDTNETDNNDNKPVKDGIYVPKQQLAVIGPNENACRIATLVYKGRVYTNPRTDLPLEKGKVLMDNKIGVTWDLSNKIEDNGTTAGYIDLQSLEDFATFGGGDDVYTVKGYDADFRLITYKSDENGERISLWECLNDFILAEGSDVFGKMNIKHNLEAVSWKSFDDWNYSKGSEKSVEIDSTVDDFIDAMYSSEPVSLEDQELRDSLFNKESDGDYLANGEASQKFIYLTTKNGIQAEVRLFKSGYVYYAGLNFIFKIDLESFNKLWNNLN